MRVDNVLDCPRRSVGRPDDGVHKEDSGSSRSHQAAWADLDWSYSPYSRQLVPVIRNGRGTFVPRLGELARSAVE